MRFAFALAVIVVHLGMPGVAASQATERLNPVIAVQEKGLPVFGIAHPAIVRRSGCSGAGAPGAGLVRRR